MNMSWNEKQSEAIRKRNCREDLSKEDSSILDKVDERARMRREKRSEAIRKQKCGELLTKGESNMLNLEKRHSDKQKEKRKEVMQKRDRGELLTPKQLSLLKPRVPRSIKKKEARRKEENKEPLTPEDKKILKSAKKRTKKNAKTEKKRSALRKEAQRKQDNGEPMTKEEVETLKIAKRRKKKHSETVKKRTAMMKEAQRKQDNGEPMTEEDVEMAKIAKRRKKKYAEAEKKRIVLRKEAQRKLWWEESQELGEGLGETALPARRAPFLVEILKRTPIDDEGMTLGELSERGIPHYYGVTIADHSIEREGLNWTSPRVVRPTYLWPDGTKISWSILKRSMGFEMVVLKQSLLDWNIRLLESELRKQYNHLEFGWVRGWRASDLGRRANLSCSRVYKLFVSYSKKVPELLENGTIMVNYPEKLGQKHE